MNVHTELEFKFGGWPTSVRISRGLPTLADVREDWEGVFKPLVVCDTNTKPLAARLCAGEKTPVCVIPAGEANKGWPAVETMLKAAKEAGLGRDGVFVALGGGVVSDLCGFAASIYMRGAQLCIVSTSLLGMVDASLGGKTGFDLAGIKNLAGTFYPARLVYAAAESLAALPAAEWKSGMAELIKTAVLDGDDFLAMVNGLKGGYTDADFRGGFPESFVRDLLNEKSEELLACVSRALAFKGRIVQSDPMEKGEERVLLNLGHSFAHALESAAGLGRVSHGEAVAWGLVRACEMGLALSITPWDRADRIAHTVRAWGYETACPHPLAGGRDAFVRALGSDKKRRGGKNVFVVPNQFGAQLVYGELKDTADAPQGHVTLLDTIINRVLNGENSL